jgi:hypothetical protein
MTVFTASVLVQRPIFLQALSVKPEGDFLWKTLKYI